MTNVNWADGLAWGIPGAAMSEAVAGADEFSATPLLDLLRAAADRAPDVDALVGPSTRIPYRQVLDLLCNVAAAVTVRVPHGQAVACILPRTPHGMVGVLGVLVSGRPALVIDVTTPEPRLAAMLDDLTPALVLSEKPLPVAHAVPRVLLADAMAAPGKAWRPDHAWDPDAPFAVHFTSGSTGLPKGIVVTARGLLFRGFDCATTHGWTPADRVYANAMHVGSQGMATLLVALARGARVVIANLLTEGVGGVLRLLAREQVTSVAAPPPIFRMLFQLDRARAAFGAVRTFRVGAGALPKADVVAWRALLPDGCAIQHTYASTEANVLAQSFVTDGDAGPESLVAAGRLMPNHDYAILSDDARSVPTGEAGELVVRGRHLALGEWRAGGVVPGRIAPAPGHPGLRVFRTGDLVRVRPDGMLRVVGRVDRQVKINGVRVEPEEAEAMLRRDPRVTDAAVVVRTGSGDARLHGFVVVSGTPEPDLPALLRQCLAATLPAVAVPATVTILDRLPTLPGGKIDLRALANRSD